MFTIYRVMTHVKGRPCFYSGVVLVLLPPSEGKTTPTHGGAVDLSSLAHASLTDAREQTLAAALHLATTPSARTRLRLPHAAIAQIATQTNLRTAATAPAHRVYTGVLYDAAGAAAWSDEEAALAASRVRILSGLWGAVSPTDRIPAYRLPMGLTLPRLGPLATHWKPHLSAALDPLVEGRLVVDCRSGAYVAAMAPRGASWIHVRIEKDEGGARSVVSHFSKHTRGLLAGVLATLPSTPSTPSDLANVAATLIGRGSQAATVVDVERGPGLLTLVVRRHATA